MSGTTTLIQEDGAGHYTNNGVWSDARPIKANCVLQMDGNWYPVTDSVLTGSLSFKRLDDTSFERKIGKGGAVVGTTHNAVSADGQTYDGTLGAFLSARQ